MLKFSAHLGYMFNELPFPDRFAAARRAGFMAVEHPDPYSLSADRLHSLLQAEGLTFIQFAFPAGNPGEKGCAALPGREREFQASVETGLDYAQAVGARFVQLQSGLIPTGAGPGFTERMWATYTANLALAAQMAVRHGITLLIEPIGAATIAGYFMDRSELALRALQEAGQPNLRILFDVFHSTVAGVDPIGFILDHAPQIGHLHIADHPGRHQPGTGTIDFPAVFAAIEQSSFTGHIGCEYKPSGRTEDSLDWFQPYRA